MVPGTLVVLAAFGCYQRLWTFVSQRDYEAVLKATVTATVIIVGSITLLHPVTVGVPSTAVTLPASVIALFFLLVLVLLLGARFVVHLIADGQGAQLQGLPQCSRCADRRRGGRWPSGRP